MSAPSVTPSAHSDTSTLRGCGHHLRDDEPASPPGGRAPAEGQGQREQLRRAGNAAGRARLGRGIGRHHVYYYEK